MSVAAVLLGDGERLRPKSVLRRFGAASVVVEVVAVAGVPESREKKGMVWVLGVGCMVVGSAIMVRVARRFLKIGFSGCLGD